MAQVEKAVSDTATKAAGDASQAVKDMPKGLPK